MASSLLLTTTKQRTRWKRKRRYFDSRWCFVAIAVSLALVGIGNVIRLIRRDDYLAYLYNEAASLSGEYDDHKSGVCKGFALYDAHRPFYNVSSIFNCDYPSSYNNNNTRKKAQCRYFYPARFLDPKCGPARNFHSSLIAPTEQMRRSHTLWKDMPIILLPTAQLNPTIPTSTNNNSHHITQNVTFIHIHKTAGTSMVTAFTSLGRKYKAISNRYTVYLPPAPPRQNELFRNRTREFLKGATTFQSPPSFPQQHHIFAVIRDPTERFISSIGQAMGAVGSTKNNVATSFAQECISSQYDARQTLRCCINYVKRNSTWVELHFSPQVLILSFATMYLDVPVAMFPFEAVPHLLSELGANPNQRMRDGTRNQYRRHDILTNMTVNDYDDRMLRDVCTIYAVDVMMIRSLGMQVPKCDPYIPRTGRPIY